MSALALSALREWHYLLGCASAQVQSSIKEIPLFSFVMTETQTDKHLFSFVMTETQTDKQTNKQTESIAYMLSINSHSAEIKEIPLFSFVMIFICDDRQTNKQTESIAYMLSN